MVKFAFTKKDPEKKFLRFIKNRAGRGYKGRITVRHRGGGAKRLYRILDFGQDKLDIPAKVVAIEYDPNRTAYIALLEYRDKEKHYVIAPEGIKVGDDIIVADNAEIKNGNRLRLKNIPVGTSVFNVELEAGKGGRFARSAGNSTKVLAQDGGETHLEMPSKEVRKVSGECFATVGLVSHSEHIYEELGKAGANRWRRVRPTVRGGAMNAVDHPHGGGEGKTPIGLKYPKTPWGKPARGVKTRMRKKWTNR
ncbi:MAG: 50S ribosomal protein L2, partial [bacterium]|nr:50S ribosomal protein L2 [bacterium]